MTESNTERHIRHENIVVAVIGALTDAGHLLPVYRPVTASDIRSKMKAAFHERDAALAVVVDVFSAFCRDHDPDTLPPPWVEAAQEVLGPDLAGSLAMESGCARQSED